MRSDLLKAELSGKAFVVHPRIMENLISAVNDGLPKAASVEKVANNSVTYETVKNVAVISIDGGMYKKDMSGACSSVASYDTLVKFREKAENDSNIDTILHRVDTPGGSVAGVDEVGDGIFNSKKKTVTLYENMGASGGIWAFSASDELYATETTMLGSIGVVVTYMEEENDKTVTIVSKNAENKRCNIGEDCQKKIKSVIDTYEDLFFARVERNTGFNAEKITSTFNNGDMIFAKEAKEAGFIKEITTFKALLDTLTGETNNGSNTAVPSNTNSIEKVATLNPEGENMEIKSADDLRVAYPEYVKAIEEKATGDATAANATLQTSLDTANASLDTANANPKGTLNADMTGQIIGMAFEHDVKDKDTMIKMVNKGTIEGAGFVAFQSGHKADVSDGGDLPVKEDAEKIKEDAAAAEAKKIAAEINKEY